MLYTGLDKPLAQFRDIADRLGKAGIALHKFAGVVDQVKPQFTALTGKARSLRAEIDAGRMMPVYSTVMYGDVAVSEQTGQEWHSWLDCRDLVDRNNDLVSRVNGVYAQLEAGEAECANTLNGLLVYTTVDQVQTFSKYQIDQWMQADHGTMPWGSQPYGNPTCVQSVGMGVKDFGTGIWTGAAALIGRDPVTGEWSWGEAGTAWKGLGETLGSLVLCATPLGSIGAMMPGPVGDVARAAQNNTTTLVKGLVDFDMWGKDPVRAGTNTLLNVGTFFLPGAGEIAGSVKASLEAVAIGGRAAEAAAGTIKAADLMVDASRSAQFAFKASQMAGKVETVLNLPTKLAGKSFDALFGPGRNIDAALGRTAADAAADTTRAGSRADIGAADVTRTGSRAADDLGAGGRPPVKPNVEHPPKIDAKPEEPVPVTKSDRDPETAQRQPGENPAGEPPTKPGAGDTVQPHAPTEHAPSGDHASTGEHRPTGDHPTNTDHSGSADHTDTDQAGADAIGANQAAPADHPADDGHVSAEEVTSASQRLLEAASSAEPRMTELMKSLADKADGSLVGLDHRLKSPDSLESKIVTDASQSGLSASEAAANIKDALRYTMQLDPAEYTGKVVSTLEDLRDQGYEINVKNFWSRTNTPYQGVNVQILTDSGQWVELQFHTEVSFAVKDGPMHELYERYRLLPDKSSPGALELAEEMSELSARIPVPPGVESIR